MAPRVTAIKRGIQTALKAVNGLNVYEQWYGNIMLPCAIVELVGVDHELTMGSNSTADFARYDFEVIVGVSIAPPLELAQEIMDGYTSPIGADSVRAALIADHTLGGLGVAIARPWERMSDEETNGIDMLAQRMPVQVYAT